MTLAIEGMSVKKERACLSQVRSMTSAITHEFVLANGWTARSFAPAYANGHQNKRKVEKRNDQPITPSV
ncbi:unnamed protein product [Ectocarpus sp. 6 AP-2014]